MKIIKKQYGLIRDELKSFKDKIEKLERDYIALINNMSDKPLHKHELALQEFIIYGFERTKLASMVDGVSKRK